MLCLVTTEKKHSTSVNACILSVENWSDGKPYTATTHWSDFHNNTCYGFNKGDYAPRESYKYRKYKILEWSDFSDIRH